MWSRAQVDERFTQNFPDEARPPTEVTEVRLLYDDRALYVAIRCHDHAPDQILERLTRRDREPDADRITLDIDSRADHQTAYHFGVNVSGVLSDGLHFNDTEYNGDWDGVWTAYTSRDAGGWSAEIEIPWKTLRFAGGSPVMGVQIRRYIPRRQEVDEWAYVPRVVSGEVSRYGKLVGASGLGPARLVQLWPYAGMRVTTSVTPPDRPTLEIVPSLGADLKLGITSSLTLDATVNPDFGQVEADQAQLNLTTFELFFPEKRPFFLEGVDLFGTPIRQFYTRRVGRIPPAVDLEGADALVEQPAQGRIWGAAKLTGQLAPHFSVAALDALTASQAATVRRGDGAVQKREVDPLTNFGILRLRYDFGNSYVGLTGTSVNRFEARGAAAPRPEQDFCPDGYAPAPLGWSGLPPRLAGAIVPPPMVRLTTPPAAPRTPTGRCTHDAYSAGLDARLVTRDGSWGATAHGIVSYIADGPPRPQPDGTIIKPGDAGYGLRVDAGKPGGENFLFGVRYEMYSPRFDINDAGYITRPNLFNLGAAITLRSTKPIGPTRESSWDVWTNHQFSFEGVRLGNGFGTWLWARFLNSWQLGAGAGYDFNAYDNRESRGGAVTERERGWWAGLFGRSDPRKPVLATLNCGISRRQRGATGDVSVEVTLRPLPQLELTFIPFIAFAFGEPRWYQTDDLDDGGRRFRFGDLAAQSFSVTFRGTYTFTPRLTVQAYAQLFLAAGHYSNFTSAIGYGERPVLPLSGFVGEACPYSRTGPCDGTTPDFREGAVNLNVVMRWEYLPGSTLIAVYTHTQTQFTYDPLEGPGKLSVNAFARGASSDTFLLKLSYLWG